MATAGTFRSLEEKHEDYDRQAKASFASHTRRRGLFVSTIFLPKNRIIILPVLISIHAGLRRRVEKRSSRARAGGTWPPATLRGWMFKERRRKVGRVSRWFVDDRVYVLHLLVHTYTSWKVASWAEQKGWMYTWSCETPRAEEGGKKERSARHVTPARSSIPYWNPPGPTWPIQGEIYPAALPATYIPTSVPSSRLCPHPPGIPTSPMWTDEPSTHRCRVTYPRPSRKDRV